MTGTEMGSPVEAKTGSGHISSGTFVLAWLKIVLFPQGLCLRTAARAESSVDPGHGLHSVLPKGLRGLAPSCRPAPLLMAPTRHAHPRAPRTQFLKLSWRAWPRTGGLGPHCRLPVPACAEVQVVCLGRTLSPVCSAPPCCAPGTPGTPCPGPHAQPALASQMQLLGPWTSRPASPPPPLLVRNIPGSSHPLSQAFVRKMPRPLYGLGVAVFPPALRAFSHSSYRASQMLCRGGL